MTSRVPFQALRSVIFQLDGNCPSAFPQAGVGFQGWLAVAGALLAGGQFRGVIEAVRG